MTFTITPPDPSRRQTITCDRCSQGHQSAFRTELERWQREHPKTCTAVRR